MNRKEIHKIQETFRALIKTVEGQLNIRMIDDEESTFLIGQLQAYQHGYELVRRLK